MHVQAEVSIYPLRTRTLLETVERFAGRLRSGGLDVTVGEMSTHVSGEGAALFAALAEAFDEAASSADVVMTLKATNASPAFSD
jgi:uncharacterized protein YqgV (UPF0045/DUF77 family)